MCKWWIPHSRNSKGSGYKFSAHATISGIVWGTSITYDWLMVVLNTIVQSELTLATQTIPEITARKASVHSPKSFWSGSLRQQPFLLALRRWGGFARRNVCDSATEIPYSFFSLSTASRLSRVGWFSHALAFRSLYYPWGKMRTTRSLISR